MTLIYEKDCIIAQGEDGATLAQVTFPAISEHTVCINHTLIHGAGGDPKTETALFGAVVDFLSSKNLKAVITCPLASKWFRKNPEYAAILFSSH